MIDEQIIRLPIGIVVAGSLSQGILVKLDQTASIENIKVGSFVTIEGLQLRFFGRVSDVSLGSTDPTISTSPPTVNNPFIAQVLAGTATYGTIHIIPELTIPSHGLTISDGPQPAKTIPAHFSKVSQASERDIELVFGKEDQKHFWIGNPLDMETKVCLNLEEFVKRSNGVFGKTGTGKTFLTRLLLIGILQSGLASNLVFDMHSEYGWKGSREGGKDVKGMKQLFSSKVAVFSLDEDHSKRRGLSPDYIVKIGFNEIEPEDIQTLSETLNLTDNATQATYGLERKYGAEKWLTSFLNLESKEDLNELANQLGEHEATIASLRRRLGILKRFQFLDEKSHDGVEQILLRLQRGMHVVLEFGRYGDNSEAYILVANLLTRRIHERYDQMRLTAEATGGRKPQPLVITIEEAHKFLTPRLAGQTIFGKIAREDRKNNVTLLVVDQRPSGIDEEVMSQLVTRITCLLDNAKDIDAVLMGQNRDLRSVLARLQTKQQALIFGEAVPMPIVVHTREYGSSQSYESFGLKHPDVLKADIESDLNDLYGPKI